MRIGFDVSQTAERMAGCGIVADQFLRHLVAGCPDDTFIPYPVFGNYRHPEFVKATRPDAPNVATDQFELSWHAVVAPWSADGDLRDALGDPDVVHANNYSCPPAIRQPIVYTVYDLSAIEAPQFHTEQNRTVCFDGMFDASIRAAHFVAISQYSRSRFLHWFPHVEADRISVVPLAARSSLTTPPTSDVANRTLGRLSLEPDGFWLAVGTIEPRKNYAALLEAYAELRRRNGRATVPLCIVGSGGWIESSLTQRIAQLNLADSVKCVGFVEDAELAALYRSCFGFVYPSRYEGFGLPVVEAMACGAPVIATRCTSLPEIVGTAGLLVEPESTGGYFDAMLTLVTDEPRRRALGYAARHQAARFSWAAAASDLREIYGHVARAGVSHSGVVHREVST
jgi:glycosyltransferase involved in cell wall biosynthesis